MSTDQQATSEFVKQFADHMRGAATVNMVYIGEQLGLYRTLVGSGPLTPATLAERTGTHPRLVTEWCHQQSAVGYLIFDPVNDTVELPDAHAPVLAMDESLFFLAGGAGMFVAMYCDHDKVLAAFRSDGGIPWGEHHPCLFSATDRFFRPGYRTFLTSMWLGALDGVVAKLEAGAAVADVGCGFGTSVRLMAERYPASAVAGFDFHGPSIDAARAGCELPNARFEVADAKSYVGSYDLICFFDCLHDMGDPVGIARHARERLAPGGTVMVVEPFALDGAATNIADNPAAATAYAASTVACVPNALSQSAEHALGAQCGEPGMRAVFDSAGFGSFRRATETPFNIIYEARA